MERRGYFYVQWWDGQNKRYLSLRTADREEAKQRLSQFIAGLEAPAAPEQPTVGKILGGYINDRDGQVVSLDSLKYAAAAVTEHLGDLQPAHIGRLTCRAYITKRRKQGRRGMTGGAFRPVSDGTIIKELVTLRTALRWALSVGWIAEMPQIEMPRTPASRDKWLSKAEAARLLEAAIDEHTRLFIMLALYTGARSGAILSLTWQQVDLVSGVINFGRGTGNKGRAIVPMIPDLLDAMRFAANVRTTDNVIEYRGKPVKSIKTGFHMSVKRAGLDHVTPHSLRHTCATWMVMSDVPMDMVARFLGNSVAMVEKVYGHHSPEWLRKAATALSGFSGSHAPENRIAIGKKT